MMQFEISDKEERVAEEFMEKCLKKDENMPTVGDRFSYCFTPTGLGVIVKIRDLLTEEEKCLTDLDNWCNILDK